MILCELSPFDNLEFSGMGVDLRKGPKNAKNAKVSALKVCNKFCHFFPCNPQNLCYRVKVYILREFTFAATIRELLPAWNIYPIFKLSIIN